MFSSGVGRMGSINRHRATRRKPPRAPKCTSRSPLPTDHLPHQHIRMHSINEKKLTIHHRHPPELERSWKPSRHRRRMELWIARKKANNCWIPSLEAPTSNDPLSMEREAPPVRCMAMEVEVQTGPLLSNSATQTDFPLCDLEVGLSYLQIQSRGADTADQENQMSEKPYADQAHSFASQTSVNAPLGDSDEAMHKSTSVQTDMGQNEFHVPAEEWNCVGQTGDHSMDQAYYTIQEQFNRGTMPVGLLVGQLPFPGPMDLYHKTFGHDSPTAEIESVCADVTMTTGHDEGWAVHEDEMSSASQTVDKNVPSGDGYGKQCLFQDLERSLKKPHPSIAIQTDYEMNDFGINTEDIIEKNLENMMLERLRLKESYQEILDKQRQVESQLHVQLRQLQQRRDEERKIHKEILKGIQDVTVKREESKKKIERERKEFSIKEPELMVEVDKLLDKNERLSKEQVEKENKVVSLVAEQSEEKEVWEVELAELKKEYSEISKCVMEETERALEAEVMSLESRKELLFLRLADAENEAKMRLAALRSVPESRDIKLLKQEWEKRRLTILTSNETLQELFKEHIQLVRNGAKLCTLPELNFPTLPPKPSKETDVVLQATQQMHPSFQQRIPLLPTPGAAVPPSQAAALQSLSYGRNSPALSAVHNVHNPQAATSLPPSALGTGKGPMPVAPTTDKLGKILEKLMVRFPQYNKAQLTAILQQIKTSRGTMAGLSMEDLYQLMAMRLTELPENAAGSAQQPLGPIGSHVLPLTQRNPALFLPPAQTGYAARGFQPASACKLCLMCQKIVQPREIHQMTCTHVLHKECIQFWAKTNQNDSCPFCPSSK